MPNYLQQMVTHFPKKKKHKKRREIMGQTVLPQLNCQKFAISNVYKVRVEYNICNGFGRHLFKFFQIKRKRRALYN